MRALDTSDILIECHDSDAFDCTEYLRSFIGKTHKVSVITAGGRNPNSFEFLTKLNEIDRWQAVNENRPYSMKWLWCEAIEQRVATR